MDWVRTKNEDVMVKYPVDNSFDRMHNSMLYLPKHLFDSNRETERLPCKFQQV